MSNTIKEVVCLLPDSSLTDQTGRLWNYRNNGGIQFFESGGVFDQPYVRLTDKTLNKSYLYTRTVEDDNTDFRLGDDFTIEFWVRNIENPTTTWTFLINYYPDVSGNVGWSITYNLTDKCFYFIDQSLGSNYKTKTVSNVSMMTDWTHIAFVKENTNMAVFVNGIREAIYNDVKNTYMIDTNIKDGLYIGRTNSAFGASANSNSVCDFGGLKISKYARYDVNLTNIDILDFTLDIPSKTYNNIVKRNDILNLFLEMQSPIFNATEGVVWYNYRDNILHTNIDSVTTTKPFYQYNINDKSVYSTSKKSYAVSVNFSSFGEVVNNVDQDYMVFWDLYIAPEWCDLSINPPSKKMNFCWENNNVADTEKVILWYGRDTTSADKSFYSIGNSSYTTEPIEANRKYFDFKFLPDVKYRMAVSYKNHKKHFYINGKKIHTRDMANYFNAGSALYGTLQDFIIGGSDLTNEINYCTKLDNIWIKVGKAIDSDIYDYNNDEYDYDFNKNLDENKFIGYSNNRFKTVESLIETWNKTPVTNYTNSNVSSNIDSTTFAIEDINDVRKIDKFTVYLEGKRNKKIEIIDIIGTDINYKTPDVISEVKAFNINNKIRFINNDELIIQDKNIKVALGYLTGELEQTECKTNGYYIKVFNHNTNRFIGEYEIIDGIFKIDNLNYYEYYDVVLCDRLNKIENQVMSKRKPTLYNNDDILSKVYSNNNIGERLITELFVDISLPKTNYDFTTMGTLSENFSLARNSTATYFNETGILADAVINQPRFDYVYKNGELKCKGLLVEVASKNLYSGNVTETNYTTNVKSTNIYNTDSYNITTTSSGNYECFLSFLANTAWNNRSMSVSVLADTTSHAHLGLRPIIIMTDNTQISSLSTWELIDGTVTPVTQPSAVNKSYEFVNNRYARFSVGVTNNTSSPSTAYFRVNPTLNHDNTVDNTHTTLLKIGLPQAEMLPYSTSYIRGANTTRSEDVLTFNHDEINATVCYVYYNQINPTLRIVDFENYINSKPNAKPSGFVSGWIEKIIVYEKVLTDAEKASELNKI